MEENNKNSGHRIGDKESLAKRPIICESHCVKPREFRKVRGQLNILETDLMSPMNPKHNRRRENIKNRSW